MPSEEQIQQELRRLEGEGPKDLRKLNDALIADFLMMFSIMLAILGLVFNSEPLCIASLVLMVEYQAYAKAKFDTLVVFVPLAVYFVELWVQSKK